jgi:hypothetical protein
MARLAMVREQIGLIEQARLSRIAQAPETGNTATILIVGAQLGPIQKKDWFLTPWTVCRSLKYASGPRVTVA